jgi:plasmid stabilization system protein ParE
LRRAVVLDAADAELVEAAKFYERKARGLGADFLHEVEHAIRRLAEYPEAGASLPDGFRRRLLRRFPYGVLYKVEENEIVIAAVMHLRRRPGYWRGR